MSKIWTYIKRKNGYVLDKFRKKYPLIHCLTFIGIGYVVGHEIFSNWNKVKEFISSIF